MKTKQQLIDAVIEEIKNDVQYGDFTAIEELLKFCPVPNLISYLPDDNEFIEYESELKAQP
jgi:hypothetical protein